MLVPRKRQLVWVKIVKAGFADNLIGIIAEDILNRLGGI
jgi:hypothetical protein